MVARTPRRYLPPAAEPWGRAVDKDIAQIKRALGITTHNALGTLSFAVSSATNAAIKAGQKARENEEHVAEVEEKVQRKTQTFRQPEMPSSDPDERVGGDQWYDTNDGNKLYVWVWDDLEGYTGAKSAGHWEPTQDQAIPTLIEDQETLRNGFDSIQETTDMLKLQTSNTHFIY